LSLRHADLYIGRHALQVIESTPFATHAFWALIITASLQPNPPQRLTTAAQKRSRATLVAIIYRKSKQLSVPTNGAKTTGRSKGSKSSTQTFYLSILGAQGYNRSTSTLVDFSNSMQERLQ